MSDRDLGYEELLARLQALERENAELRGRLGIGGSAPRSQDLPPMDSLVLKYMIPEKRKGERGAG